MQICGQPGYASSGAHETTLYLQAKQFHLTHNVFCGWGYLVAKYLSLSEKGI